MICWLVFCDLAEICDLTGLSRSLDGLPTSSLSKQVDQLREFQKHFLRLFAGYLLKSMHASN